MNYFKVITRIVLILIVLAIVVGCENKESYEQFARTTQKEFFSMNAEYANRYKQAQNEIKKSQIFNELTDRRINFCEANYNIISFWVGKITTISTPKGGGEVYVIIKSELNNFSMIFTTKASMFSSSTIKQGSEVYNQVAELRVNQPVIFSGVINYEKNPEKSVTEWMSVNAPEFTIDINSIGPIIPTRGRKAGVIFSEKGIVSLDRSRGKNYYVYNFKTDKETFHLVNPVIYYIEPSRDDLILQKKLDMATKKNQQVIVKGTIKGYPDDTLGKVMIDKEGRVMIDVKDIE